MNITLKMGGVARNLGVGLLLAAFCVPMFVGLGATDFENDEAIYSFAVDRILETGDWLVPKSSPFEEMAFLEKPPLKFWIVALPIRLGVLPHDEFGIRFWDALFGAVAFAYVFAFGVRLAGFICGSVALLILFVHWPLLFEHGLRSNNMEAPLVLGYCGGMFHYVRWASADDTGSRRWHAASVGLYFVLGFMTKFVAALFLPLTLAVATLLSRDARVRLARDRRLWCGVSILALVLIGPWFAFASVRFGSDLWQTMFQAHVVTRFTDSLDPTHVQPWHFYVTELYRWLAASDSHLLVLAGLALLVAQSISQRWFDGGLVVLWFGLPILFISAATSKIYHYAYPFLPPLALAGGYLAARGATLAVRMLDSGFRALDRQLTTRVPILVGIRKRPAVYAIFCGVAVIAAIAAAATIVYGPIRLTLGGSDVLRNSGIVRPLVVLALTGTLAGSFRATNRIIVAVILVSLLPIQAYRDTLPLLAMERHPMRTASECLARFESQPAGGLPGLYMDDRYVSHPLYYYFRRVRPVTRTGLPDLMAIDHYLFNPPEWRPLLLSESTYQDFMNDRAATGWRTPSPPMIAFPDVLLLLPGPFERCAAVPGVPARHRAR